MSDEGVRWWWLRHAPVPNATGIITGRLDWSSDTSGRAEFQALARRLPRGAVLVSSGQRRCRQTIEALTRAGLELPDALVDDALDEQDFGRWQGRSWNELAAEGDPDLARFWESPADMTPPGGESFAAMVTRVESAIARLGAGHAGRDIISVVHAGTIRSALAVALRLTPLAVLSFAVEPLSLTRLDALAAGWRVAGVNWPPL